MKNADFKREKPFSPYDIIVYVVIAVILVGITLAVFLPEKKTLLKADIYYGDDVIYTYTFADGKGDITEYGVSYVTVEKFDGVTNVTIVTPLGKNVAEIGRDYVKMAEADCSSHPDCVEKFSPIKTGGKVTVCMPHKIRIVTSGDIGDEVKL